MKGIEFVDFVIYYEHETRELENCILLQHELNRRGYNATVVKISSYKALLYKTLIIPKVIIIPYCYTEELMTGFVPYNNNKTVKIVNLQLEQVLSNALEELGFHNPKGVAKKAFHITWGNLTRERLLKNGIQDENVLLTGAIQLDFLKEEFRGNYYNKSELAIEYKIPNNKKWVLYISSFTYTAIKGDMSLERLKEDLSKNSDKSMSREIVEEFYSLSVKSKQTTLNWIYKLLKEEDIVFIYRPHPAEKIDADDILELKKCYPEKFYCISELSIRQWIISSDILCTWFSTSIVEAYFAKKQCYVIRPYNIPTHIDSVLYKNCKAISRYEEFKGICSASAKASISNEEFPISAQKIEDYYGVRTGELACNKICDHLERIIHDSNDNKYPYISNSVGITYQVGKIGQYLLSTIYMMTSINVGLVFSKRIYSRINRESEKKLKQEASKKLKKIRATRYWKYEQ